MRKSRAAHIKCDCGEKTSKCAHLQPTIEGHRETCCCNHGGRCTCGHTIKEPGLDPVPEVDSTKNVKETANQRPRPPVRRRRANTVHSDGPLTFDQHGNHKPIHKPNKIASKSSPYQLGRVNSMHGSGTFGSRSPDGFFDGSVRDTTPGGASVMPSSHRQRRVKSEATSPLLAGASGLQQLSAQLPPLDLSGIKYPSYMPNASFDLFGGAGYSEQDAPIFSAGLSAASVDWSHIELPDRGTESFAPSSYGQPCGQSLNGVFDWGTGSEQAPTLAATASTSCEASEVEDNFLTGDVDLDAFNTGDAAAYMRSNQLFSGPDLGAIDYDAFLKHSSSKFDLPPPAASSLDDAGATSGASSFNFEDDPVFWGQQFNDGITTYDSADGVPLNTDLWNTQ
ncbi:copper fist DNA binding domain-containing protein [Sodiomyces alkalinus F11]|uniref:Copper fist DNA binding domain-containing protein n=1 Tax=Sodiomyces alkalinus (strain CBS 110278 / VKM F-3762 / F11) TaxID=1314773 RepID=A0A3N2Q976_SODAK|nr:copper fist DNA binding domain-containing protein [Sodiomyces alkalinus F11]ROT43331.1 copper fist DNA binding domain-containing protein [Sodiomyces alkalinus F11]